MFLTRMVVLVLALAMSAGAGSALTFEPVRTKDGQGALIVSGEIVAGDDERLLEAFFSGIIESRVLIIDSVGGDLFEGMALGRTARFYGFETIIPSEASCYSACFFFFLGGEYRSVFEGGSVCVHQFSGGSQAQTRQAFTQFAAGTIIKFTTEMGVSPRTAQIALQTAPGDIYVFTQKQLYDYLIQKPPSRYSFAEREAKRLGLTLKEWRARRQRFLAQGATQVCHSIDRESVAWSICLQGHLNASGLER